MESGLKTVRSLFVLLLLVFKHYLFLVRVVTRDSLNFSEGRHFKLVACVAVKELAFLVQHFLHCLAHVVI